MAFAGESQARNRYTFFAKQARTDGYEQIAEVFEKTASEEKAHAKRFFRLMVGGEVEIQAKFPAGVIASTADNLEAAASGEHKEWGELYPSFAAVARQEGFADVAKAFASISVAEKGHEKRYLALLERVRADTVFKREEVVTWRCRECGYLHKGKEAPDKCPACDHPRAFFELEIENW
jgi:rubrerythrin